MGWPRNDFRLLHARLVSAVRARVRNGEISERGLARLTGISQPHIHNVLKGARLLSLETADQIMDSMRIDLADLLTDSEKGTHLAAYLPDTGDCQRVPLLDGWIGTGHAYPAAIGPQRYPFADVEVQRMRAPVAAKLAPDPLRAPMFRAGGVVLLDGDEQVRLDPDEQGYFALDLAGGGTIGLVRRARRQVSLWVCQTDTWHAVRMRDRDPLDIIRGRVGLLVKNL